MVKCQICNTKLHRSTHTPSIMMPMPIRPCMPVRPPTHHVSVSARHLPCYPYASARARIFNSWGARRPNEHRPLPTALKRPADFKTRRIPQNSWSPGASPGACTTRTSLPPSQSRPPHCRSACISATPLSANDNHSNQRPLTLRARATQPGPLVWPRPASAVTTNARWVG